MACMPPTWPVGDAPRPSPTPLPVPRGKALWPGGEARADGPTWPGSSASSKVLAAPCTSPTAAPSLPIPTHASLPASQAAEPGSLPHRRDLKHLLEAQPAVCSCRACPASAAQGCCKLASPLHLMGRVRERWCLRMLVHETLTFQTGFAKEMRC